MIYNDMDQRIETIYESKKNAIPTREYFFNKKCVGLGGKLLHFFLLSTLEKKSEKTDVQPPPFLGRWMSVFFFRFCPQKT